jgi:hypothetical protein
MRLAIFDGRVYFTARDAGVVGEASLDGGAFIALVTGEQQPTELAVDATGVYWLNWASGRVPKEPGSFRDMNGILRLTRAVDGQWETTSTLLRTPAIASVPIANITLAAGQIYYSTGHDVRALNVSNSEPAADPIVGSTLPGNEAIGLAVSGDALVWSTRGRSAVERDDIALGVDAHVDLAVSQSSLLFPDLAIHAGYVYWANGERLLKTPWGASAAEQVTTTPNYNLISAFAVAPDRAVLTTDDGRVLASALGADSLARPVARDQPTPTSVLIHEGRAIWATAHCRVLASPLGAP